MGPPMHTALVLATLLSQTPVPHDAPRTLDLSLQRPQPPRAPGGASLLAPAPLAEPPRMPVTRWVRIPVMAAGGLVLGTAAGLGGMVALNGVGGRSIITDAQVGAGVGGALLGTSFGVWGPSALMGGQGSYGATALGTLAGAGAGLLVIAGGVNSGSDALANASLWVGAALPVVGAIVGHEWSAPSTPQDLRVMPSLAVGASGAQAGLSGRF